MRTYNVLILGSGGRESALAWKIKGSPLCGKLYIAPGNGGTLSYGENIALSYTDFQAIKEKCLSLAIDIVVVGSEEPLVKGIYNFFKADPQLSYILIVAPSAEGAQLEGSKSYAKQFMQKYGIPTASYRSFTKAELEAGIAYISSHSLPIVLKVDGLAAGKGVVIAPTTEEAIATFEAMFLSTQYGNVDKIVVEQFLTGIEMSAFVLTDGNAYVRLPDAKDYKRIYNNDQGPNTGGMGAVSPVPFADASFNAKVVEQIIKPTLEGIGKEGLSYNGFIFFGLINVDGSPYVIEYNCRLGDPETEVILPRLQTDLIELFLAMEAGKLQEQQVTFNDNAAVTVMLVAEGYPGSYPKGNAITLSESTDSLIFHAGTQWKDGMLLTNGGRLIAVTSYGETIKEAAQKSYTTIANIAYEGKYCRTDIGREFID